MNQMIKKDFTLEVKEVKADGTFSGYGSVFGNVDAYGDIVDKGAFVKSLEGKKPALLWQHYADQPIGVWSEVREDDHGLYMEGKLLIDDVAQAKEAFALIKAGAVSGLSIGFVPVEWAYDKTEQGEAVRHLKAIDLWEVSLVTFPANDAARVASVKSVESIRDVENVLRDAGFSRGEAKTLISRIRDFQRDAETKAQNSETLDAAVNLLNIIKG